MVNAWLTLAIIVALLNLIVLTGSVAVMANILYQRHSKNPPPGIGEQRLRAYHELMTDIIALNQKMVGLSADDEFIVEQERLVMDQGSVLDDLFDNVMETYYRNFYIVDEDVQAAAEDYIEFVSSYHPEGVEIHGVLTRSGKIIQSIRSDIGLSDVFPDAIKEGEMPEDSEIPPDPEKHNIK